MINKINVVIPVAAKDIDKIKLLSKFVAEKICAKHIYVITSNKNNFPQVCGVSFIDENSLRKGLTYENVDTYIKKRGGSGRRTGWYFQQFLKMEYAFLCDDEFYLIWDADTIPLKKINFFSDDGERMLFNMKDEHHAPYFEVIDKIFGENIKKSKKSFISEGMIISTKIMKEMINIIEEKYKKPFYYAILDLIGKKDLNHSGFSEFETYGTYLINKYPQMYEERKLHTQRHGRRIYGKMLNEAQLKRLNYDTISFEDWDVPVYVRIIREIFRRL